MVPRWLRTFEHPGALALAACSGVLYCIGFCGFDQASFAWVCLVPVLWALDDERLTRTQAAGLAWAAGCVAHLGCYTWIIYMLRTFAFLPWPLALLGYALLCVAQSSLFAAWGLGFHWLVHRRGVPGVWAAPIAMVLAEWVWPAIFPSYLADSQYQQIWAIQSLDVWGPLGLTFLLTMASAVIYHVIARLLGRRQKLNGWAVAAFLILFAANLLYGYGRIADLDDTIAHADKRVTVGLVQANVGIYEKGDNPQEGLRRHREQSLEVEAQGAQLVVWPESGYYYALYDETTNVKSEVLGKLRTPLLFGGLRVSRHEGSRQIYNTAFMADRDGKLLGSYDKTFLLMFGEYLPLGEWLPWIYRLSPQTSHFTRGTHTRPLALDGVNYGALICYEDILPGFVRQVMTAQPDVLVNITNDAWFGRSHEPRIHLALATLRAVEQRRYLVRTTNTGISAIIDPLGRVVAETKIFTRANLVGDVVPMKGVTFYQRYGDWMGIVCAVVALIFSWGAIRTGVGRLRPAPVPLDAVPQPQPQKPPAPARKKKKK